MFGGILAKTAATETARTTAAGLFALPTRALHAMQALSAPWKLGKLNHVAIAVPNLDESISFYKDTLKADVSGKEDLPEHGVTTSFVNLGDTKIELLHPFGEKSPIANFLEKNKAGGIHHICIEVDDINEAIKHVREKGIRTLGDAPKIGAHGKPVIFLHPKDCNGVLTELEEA